MPGSCLDDAQDKALLMNTFTLPFFAAPNTSTATSCAKLLPSFAEASISRFSRFSQHLFHGFLSFRLHKLKHSLTCGSERPSPANQRSADSGIYNSSAQNHMTMPVEVALAQLRADARDLWMPREVPRLAVPPTPLAFLRDFVMPSTPVIVRGALREWR